MSMVVTEVHLGIIFGIAGKSYADMNDPDIIGADLGWTIGQFQARFPNYYHMLKVDLKWSDADILGRTYFTAAYNEAHLFGYRVGTGFAFGRTSVFIPSGKHWANSELRSGMGTQMGAAANKYYGNGGTEVCFLASGWKSHYGAQNDDTYLGFTPWNYPGEGNAVDMTTTTANFNQPALGANVVVSVVDSTNITVAGTAWVTGGGQYTVMSKTLTTVTLRNDGGTYFSAGVGNVAAVAPGVLVGTGANVEVPTPAPLCLGGGYEWCHSFRVQHLSMTGTKGSGFNNSTKREAGVMMWWPGENSGVFDCLLTEFNDFGIIMSGAPAPGRTRDCSFFWNGVAGTGIRGCARADMEFSHSGDYNPYSFYFFRQGETIESPNGAVFWPCFQPFNAGGNVTIVSPKVESFACRSGFLLYSACTPDRPGNGQMFARLTGRFNFTVIGGSSYAHSGSVDTFIRVIDDFADNGGPLPLANSSINIVGHTPIRFAHWLHIPKYNLKYVCNPADTDLHSGGLEWCDLENGGVPRNPRTKVNIASVAATYSGTQPFSNDLDPIVYNHNAAPTKGYNTITGYVYP